MIRETDTRDKLKKALTILLKEKSLNDISVSELTKIQNSQSASQSAPTTKK